MACHALPVAAHGCLRFGSLALPQPVMSQSRSCSTESWLLHASHVIPHKLTSHYLERCYIIVVCFYITSASKPSYSWERSKHWLTHSTVVPLQVAEAKHAALLDPAPLLDAAASQLSTSQGPIQPAQ